MKLNLTVKFTAGRYHGQVFPPSPARLFQAMIAGSHRGGYGLINTDARDEALMWLERLAPPNIAAGYASETGADITNYVPNNDNAYTHIRTAKSMRAFVLPGEKIVRYVWTCGDTDRDKKNAHVVCAIAALITSLGHGLDEVLVHGELAHEEVPQTNASISENVVYQPRIVRGGKFASPRADSYQAYKMRYERTLQEARRDHRPDPRAYDVRVHQVEYEPRHCINLNAPLALFEMYKRERAGERLDYDPRRLRQPSGMVRHAVTEWLERAPHFHKHYGDELISRLAFGHEPRSNDNAETPTHYNGAHISYVPLPSMRRDFVSDGYIRRVLLVGNGCEDDKAQEFFFDLASNLNGAELKDEEGSQIVGYLQRVENPVKDKVLPFYQSKEGSRVWRSVTPIILTGLTRRGRSPEQLIVRALGQMGLSESDVDSVATHRGPIVPKTERPLDYYVNGHLTSTSRFHAEIIFKRPVCGVLVVGRGRNVGFGLMMPWCA
jgi:CRISPR-associated protein Csb2